MTSLHYTVTNNKKKFVLSYIPLVLLFTVLHPFHSSTVPTFLSQGVQQNSVITFLVSLIHTICNSSTIVFTVNQSDLQYAMLDFLPNRSRIFSGGNGGFSLFFVFITTDLPSSSFVNSTSKMLLPYA